MNEQEFNNALLKIRRILRETSEISAKDLIVKLSSTHLRIDRENLAFILGKREISTLNSEETTW